MSGGLTGREIATTIDSWKYKSGFVSFPLSAWDALREYLCVLLCVYVGGCSSQSTRPSTRVGCLCGEVWTNVLLQISKITVIRNSFLFASYSLLHPPTLKCFLCHTSPLMLCVCLCVCLFEFVWACCVFYSLALYSKWCPAASCVHQLVWSACLRRFLLLFTGRGIGIEHWNRPDRNSETDICLMLMRIPSIPLSIHCQHGSLCCANCESRRRVADVSVNLSMLASDKLY